MEVLNDQQEARTTKTRRADALASRKRYRKAPLRSSVKVCVSSQTGEALQPEQLKEIEQAFARILARFHLTAARDAAPTTQPDSGSSAAAAAVVGALPATVDDPIPTVAIEHDPTESPSSHQAGSRKRE